MQPWWDEWVLGPVRALAREVPRDAVVTDVPGRGPAIETLYRHAPREQWAGWPPEMTTDGIVHDLLWRPGPASLAVAGRIWIDFTGRVAPVLTVFDDDGDDVVATLHVGDVDPETGGPPSLSADVLLLAGWGDDGTVVPHRTERRRLVPVVWTQVAVVARQG